MPSALIVISGPPLPGRWALARAVEKRLGARRFPEGTPRADLEAALQDSACVLVDGDLATSAERAELLLLSADERVLVNWICARAEADREIFHRYASRPPLQAEAELARYLEDARRREPVRVESSGERLVQVGAQAPLADQVLAVVTALAPRAPPPVEAERRPRVLLVEDDADERQITAEVLRELGCAVEIAPDGAVALDLLADDPDGIDLVLTDQQMPGLSGIELVREIGRRCPHVRAALITAYGDRPTIQEALDQRAVLLEKPLSVMDLRRVIDELVR
jgi:CheY-like chemotaxis protein